MAELPDELRLAVGDSHELTLPGLGTAGYRWDHEVVGDPGVVAVSWRRGFGPGEGPDPRSAGASAPERLTVTGTAPGRVTLLVSQGRPWEQRPPRAQHTIQVLVGAAGEPPTGPG
jgi:hypothetical protein